ncbi:MAG: ABC transporter ATP-binding protein [Kiritimatiellia bacterium]
MTAAISVESVSKKFGSVTALDNVSLDIREGELFFLLGPSGCGKTTLLRILAGLETADSGRIFFDDHDIATLPPHERGAPMVFQNYALWPHLTVAENVAFGLVERKVPRAEIAKRVAEALKRVDMAGLGERSPGQLSGGQQQRVVLARALVLNPRFILLDEPLSNLDAKLRHEMREEIEALHARTEITFVYVTHDQVEALSLADRMVVMRGGRILGLGAPADLYHRPPNAFCAGFLGEANLFAAAIQSGGRLTGGPATIKGPWGVWQATAAVPVSGAAMGMVRPEHLRPLDLPGIQPATADDNVFEARVTRARMVGATLAVHLEADGVTLRATLLNRYGAEPAALEGRTLRWAVSSSETILLAPDTP